MPRPRRPALGTPAPPATTPPDLDTPPEAANRVEIDRQYNHTEGQHPEAQHGQKAENAADNKDDSHDDSNDRGPGDPELPVAQTYGGHVRLLSPRGLREPLPATRPSGQIRGKGGSNKTFGWHGRNVFAICSAHRRPQPGHFDVIPGSSVVEQSAVNRLVAGSNPARGATSKPRRNRGRGPVWSPAFFCGRATESASAD